MRNIKEDAKHAAFVINKLRINNTKFTDASDIKTKYAKEGGRMNGPISSFLIGNNIIVKSYGKYVFADYNKPVHYGQIEKLIADIRLKRKNQYDKQKNINSLEKINTNVEPIDDTQMMIDTLKSRGYKILKPITQYEEV